ncbi:MAG: NAD-dependent epimerase/dehydratase family protein [Alphaproteobacteria bacterium]|nr:NAD-dependent epimerase/dehydratase family protein [Alphaproteobacteria bacterium]
MNILFIGGTGQISLPCVHEAIKQGHKVSVFNRGQTSGTLPDAVNVIIGDMDDDAAYGKLGALKFDVVCQFMAFTAAQVTKDIGVFAGNTDQYILISSTAAYSKSGDNYFVNETTPTINPGWPYSEGKIECEAELKASEGLKWTIIRPAHTVRTNLPAMLSEGDVVGHRLLAGKPILVAGDGLVVWTMTRSVDFAVPFVRIFGKAAAIGEDYHISSGRGYTWNAMYEACAKGLGVEANLVHVPADTLIKYEPEWAGRLFCDKIWNTLLDNSKIKALVGEFECCEDLDEVLADSIMNFKTRVKADGSQVGDMEALMDRIAKEQLALGEN